MENPALIEYRSENTSDLKNIADAFFEQYSEPGIFLVYGEMGAGKTTFISALCRKLGFEFQGSPTFSLVNEYRSGKNIIFHFDLYRINKSEELAEFGFEEYLDDSSWVFIEWPEIAKPYLTGQTNSITIEDRGDYRSIQF